MHTIKIGSWDKDINLIGLGLEEISWKDDDQGWLYVYEGVITENIKKYLETIKHRIYER